MRNHPRSARETFWWGWSPCWLQNRNDWTHRIRSHELFYGCNQLIFLHRFCKECRRTFLHGAVTMFCSSARRYDHHRNSPRRRTLPQLRHQFITGHARHFEVGDYEVATVLRDEFCRFEAVGGQLHAVAALFQHAAYEFAHADRVVCDHDDTFVLDTIDCFRRDAALRNCRGTGRKDACRARRRLQRLSLARLRSNHAVQIDKQNQTAVRRDRRAGEKLYAPKIFTEALDHDFILAENFLDDQADLPVVRVRHDHAEVAVNR